MSGAQAAELVYAERPAAGTPRGLLILHHGRGTDERDLLMLGDALDPGRELLIVTPRGPLVIEGWPGYHWYGVPRVGTPDPETFEARAGRARRLPRRDLGAQRRRARAHRARAASRWAA